MKNNITVMIFILVLTLTQLTACGFHKGNSEEYKTPARYAEELQAKIMECFMNKDKNTLKSFFSEYTLAHCPELEEQMEAAFALFDGEIVSYDEPHGDETGGFYAASADNIMTDQGTEYRIIINGNLNNMEDESTVGLGYIKVLNITECHQREERYWDDYIVYIGTGY